MKRGLVAGLVAVGLTGTVWTEEVNIVEAGPNHRVMQVVREESDPWGKTKLVPHQWQELATGLNRWDEDAKAFVPAEVQFEPLNTGHVIARKTAHQLILSPELSAEGAVELWGPENLHLRSTVLGIGVVDSVTGTNYLLATAKEKAELEVVSDSEVLIRDAFDSLSADIRYTIGLNCFEQDLILREQLTPELLADLGVNPKNARLFLMTEFFRPPQPRTKPSKVATTSGKVLADTTLEFGSMTIGAGRAFSEEEGQTKSAAGNAVQCSIGVGKEWKVLDGRQFLIESVQYEDLAPILEKLPVLDQARADTVKSKGTQMASLTKAKTTRQAKAPRFEHGKLLLGETKVVSIPRSSKGLAMGRTSGATIDYETVFSQSGLTLKSDTTYYVTGSVTLSGTTTIEGGTVVKYAANASSKITLDGIHCRTDRYRPAIFTSVHDDTVGQVIVPDSNHNPWTSYAATIALQLPNSTVTTLEHLRISHAARAIYVPGTYSTGIPTNTTHNFRHLQIVHCERGFDLNGVNYSGIYYYRALNAGNILLQNVNWPICGAYVLATAEHWTVDGAAQLTNLDGSGNTMTLRNSVLANVTSLGTVCYTIAASYNGFYNTSVSGSPAWTVYQTPFESVGAGAHYLTAASGFQDKGTSSIESALSLAIKKKTTYAPIELTAIITSDTVLRPQAQRDTNTLDLGFHYDPLDYTMSGIAVNNATLLLTNGVALGVYGSCGLELQSGAKLRSEGDPINLNQLVRYQLVQEQTDATGYAGTTPSALFKEGTTTAVAPDAQFRFTAMVAPSAGGDLFNGGAKLTGLAMMDCQLLGGRFSFKGDSTARTLALTNNLFERVACEFGNTSDNLTAYAYNNLFRYSCLNLKPPTGSTWTWKDNVFDNTPITQGANGIPNSNNAYLTGATTLTPVGGGNVALASFAYVTSTLGRYYQSGTALQNGSRLAALAGLYHYTAQTGSTKEGDTQVDIGFHYVVLSAGKPKDTDGDGLPDYLEDRDGDNVLDDGETDYQNADTDYDGRSDYQEWAEDTNSRDAISATPVRLGYWRFNTTQWRSEAGFLPKASANLTALADWSGTAVNINSASAAYLTYKDLETGGLANFNCRKGSVRFWFCPSWASGTGPGAEGRLLEMGDGTTTGGRWSLIVNATGTQISLQTALNGTTTTLCSAALSVQANTWHQVVVVWSSSATQVYIDGVAAQIGGAVTIWPVAASRAATGLALGATSTGASPAKAQFDELETFNYPLATTTIAADYAQADAGSIVFEALPAPRLTLSVQRINNWDGYGSVKATLTLSGMVMGRNYQIYCKDSANSYWRIETSLPASATPTTLDIDITSRPTVMFAAADDLDTDQDGLPDAYEFLATFTDPASYDTGSTGISDGDRDLDGDGWMNLQEMAKGTNPLAFDIPPVPTGVALLWNPTTKQATVTWAASPGAVAFYRVVRHGTTAAFSLNTTQRSVTDTTLAALALDANNLPDAVYYSIEAVYNNGAGGTTTSALATTDILSDFAPFTGTGTPPTVPNAPLVQASEAGVWSCAARGPNGTLLLLVPSLPATATGIRLFKYDADGTTDNGSIEAALGTNPLTDVVAGRYVIPAAFLPHNLPADPRPRHHLYQLSLQVMFQNGKASAPTVVNSATLHDWLPEKVSRYPGVVGNQQVLQNVYFLLRSGGSTTFLDAFVIPGFFPAFVYVEDPYWVAADVSSFGWDARGQLNIYVPFENQTT